MNMKATAIMTSLVMVLAATAVVLAYESDAVDPNETVPKGDVYVAVGGTATVEFVVTEPDDGYYTNEVTWTAGGTEIFGGTATPGTTNAKIGNIATVTIEADGEVEGKYVATITAGSTAGDVSSYSMTYTVSTFINETSNGSVEQAIAYTMNVHVIAYPLPGSLSLEGLKYGVYVEPSPISSGLNTTDFVYYAIGLPKGMQMTPDGDISGTPVSEDESNQGTYDVTVVATHVASNQTFFKTYEDVTVSAADSDAFTYSVTGADTVVDSDSDDDDGRYIVRQSSTSPVTLTTQIGRINANIDHVYVVNATGSQTEANKVEGQTGRYTIPVDGSGSYRVVMVNGDLVKSFELVVVAISYDVETGIGFSPNTQP